MPVSVQELLESMKPLFDQQRKQFEAQIASQIAEATNKRFNDIEADINRQKKFGTLGSGGPVRLSDQLKHVKELANRPSDVPRTMSLTVPLRTKDVLNVSSQFPTPIPIVAGLGEVPVGGVRSLIPQTEITSGAYQYIRETGFTNAAAPVSEGQSKPQSDKTFTPVTGVVETIAHWIRVSRQCYDDLPSLVTAIDANLIYGLNWKLEQQLLKGTGVSPQIQGIYPLAPAATFEVPVDDESFTFIDTLFLAAAEVAGKGYAVSGAVVSASDYVAMQRLKDTTGRYILSDRVTLPRIVVSPHLNAGEWLVGDFNQARIFLREDASIVVGTAEDDFVKNLVRLLGEMRLGLAVFQTAGFVKNPTVTP